MYYTFGELVRTAVEKRYNFIVGARGNGKIYFYEMRMRAYLIARLIEILKSINKND